MDGNWYYDLIATRHKKSTENSNGFHANIFIMFAVYSWLIQGCAGLLRNYRPIFFLPLAKASGELLNCSLR